MKRLKTGAAVALLLLLAQVWAPAADAAGESELGDDLVALSLAALQEALEASEIDPGVPLPLTQILGVFLHQDRGDVVLLGRHEEPGAGVVPILPDDIAIAMRSIWISDEVPGMSIDPIADDASGAFQRVVYFGRIEDTRAGLYAFRCDYWLKRLAAGAIPSPIPGFSRYVDLLGGSSLRTEYGNRFWFQPKVPGIQITPAGDLMVFEDIGVELLTERDRSRFSGARTHHLYMGRDPVAQHFAQAFTQRFDELAATYPDLIRLRNFFALAQVFGWIEQAALAVGKTRMERWEYLLHRYVPVPAHCPTQAPTVTTAFMRGSEVYRLSGGVSAEIRMPAQPAIDATGRLARLASHLAAERPLRGSPFWTVGRSLLEASPLRRLRRQLAGGRSVGWLRRLARELGEVLGIEPLEDGRLAVLYRSEEGLRLSAVDREGTTPLAAGDRASERFDEIARAVCRSASDADLAFVHIRKRGESFIFQVGEAQEHFTTDEVSSLLEDRGAGSRLERLFLEAGTGFGVYRDGLTVARESSPPESSPPLDDPVLWAVALRRHFAGRLRFHVTDDPNHARRNLPRAALPTAAGDLVVLLRQGASGPPPVSDHLLHSLELRGIRVAQSLADVGDATHLLFVSSGTRDEVLEDLEALGRQGRLRDRSVILYAPRAQVDLNQTQELIERFGMVSVAHHLQEIEPVLLEAALREVESVLQDAATVDAPNTGDRLLGDALGRAARDLGTASMLSRGLGKLEKTVLQI